MLQYTSFLFGLVGYLGTRQGTWIGPAFIFLMGTSILYHAGRQNDIFAYHLDKYTVHIIVFGTIIEASMRSPSLYILGYWLCLVWMVYAYYLSKKCHLPGRAGCLWHSSVHVAGSLGATLLLL